MVTTGISNYRLSLSWPRLYPTGEAPLNNDSVAFYNNLIDTLLANGIEPFVTLYHWDLPNDLEVNYGGWLNSSMVSICVRVMVTGSYNTNEVERLLLAHALLVFVSKVG